MTQKERADVYTIPPNFAKEGTILSGRVEARNAIEAAVLVLLLFQILMQMDLGVRGRIYVGIIVILPVAIFSVIGVQGESLTSFLIQFFRYLTHRRMLTVPNGQYRLKRSRRIKKRQKKQCRRDRKKEKKRGGGKHRKRSKGTEAKTQRSEARREAGTENVQKEAQGRTDTLQPAHQGSRRKTQRR